MSRLVMNMLQLEFGVIPSIVKKESREKYIKSLDKSQSEGTSTAFIEFMLEHHIDNLESSITEYRRSIEEDTLNLKNDTLNNTNDTINDTLNQSAKERQILNLINSDNNITIMEIINKTGFSRPTVTRAIKTMKEQHILERSGARKNGYWVVH